MSRRRSSAMREIYFVQRLLFEESQVSRKKRISRDKRDLWHGAMIPLALDHV
ncbi:hypothetical protein [uncultured Roseobacter sp.]|uniref:hypothetical protein n=1 Tax=uncultured Roseobacter sp. TaxID=114847 RepID=UPI00262FAA99|nr:hypothetical protein [uncultured Roseobacter sp.]